ncbi:MAG: hypothetical protein EXR70_13100 [Deltaproteobacteria bacterium]|nr:hypothetical protein [Deltaproteobacteria bacterium]
MSDDSELSLDSKVAAGVVSAKPASNLPFLLTLIALFLYFAFQSLSLFSERANMGMMKANQDVALQEAQKIQSQFKLLVTKTSELAGQGHAGARMIMDGLQKQGVGFAPESAPPMPATPVTKATK